LAAYGSSLLLTLTNPLTILLFAGVVAGLGLVGSGSDYWAAGMLVAGVLVGSALWWLLRGTIVSLVRAPFTPRHALRQRRLGRGHCRLWPECLERAVGLGAGLATSVCI